MLSSPLDDSSLVLEKFSRDDVLALFSSQRESSGAFKFLTKATTIMQLSDAFFLVGLLLDSEKYRSKGRYMFDKAALRKDWEDFSLQTVETVGNAVKNLPPVGYVLRLAKKCGVLDRFGKRVDFSFVWRELISRSQSLACRWTGFENVPRDLWQF